MKKCILFVLLLFMAGCGGGGGGGGVPIISGGDTTTPPGSVRKWTYMVYMGGDNNLSTAGLNDLNEMEKAGSDSNINIVLQSEFSKKYTNFSELGLSYSDQTLRFLVKSDNNPDDINLAAGQAIGNVNMASAATLKDFIVWAKNTYPAENYALVIWDHGAGWKKSTLKIAPIKGAIQDDTSNAFMSLPDMAKAVRDSGVKFNVINFDACLMAMYEVAYEFKGLADYLVFSESIVPGDGDPYDTILGALKQNPAMTGLDLGKTMVNKFHESYTSGGRTDAVTRSLVDMAKIDTLHTRVVQLADAIISEFSTVSSVVAAAQDNTQSYEFPENHDLYAFATYLEGHLAGGSTKTAATAVKSAVGSAVVLNKSFGSKVADSHGLAIYAPTRNQVSSDGARDDLQKYSTLAINGSRANTWVNAVNLISSNLADTVLKPGGFAFYVKWNTDADLDLYVWEPCGAYRSCEDSLHSPWMGATTPNGFFSADSATTGVSEEYYVANQYVEAGQYDVLINYFENGLSKNATAQIWYIDPQNGINEFTLLKTAPMNLSAPYTGDFSNLDSLNDLNAYSDWWYPNYVSRAPSSRYESVQINSGQRTIRFQINRKKSVPGFTHIKR